MTPRKHVSTKTALSIPAAAYAGVHEGIVTLVQGARYAAARNVNALMTSTYWEIGRRMVDAEQQGKRRAHQASGHRPDRAIRQGLRLAQPVTDARVLPRVARHIADAVCNMSGHASTTGPEIADGNCNICDRLVCRTLSGSDREPVPLALVSLRPPAVGSARPCTTVL